MGTNYTQEFPPKHQEKHLYFEGDRAWQHIAQRGCKVGDFENMPGHVPVQLDLGKLALVESLN